MNCASLRVYLRTAVLDVALTNSGYGAELPLQNYNNAFRAQRKIVAQTFNPSMVSRYYHIQEAEARKLAKSILDDPSALISQTKLCV